MDEIVRLFPQLTTQQIQQFTAMERLYVDWNGKINVISRKDTENIFTRHILHSLAIAKTDLIKPGQTVMDIGCGGGFPVVPLAVLMPDVKFTAVDSIGKKIIVVNAVVEGLGLENVRALNCRAESVPETFDWVVSRAVTDLRTFVGWTKGKTRNGILHLKGGDLTTEIAEAGRKTKIYNISDWFADPFFETKQVLHVK